MNASEMTDVIAFMSVVDPAVATRIKRAGARGFAWPLCSREFSDCGYSQDQMNAFANASALTACEVQCVVEAWGAERRGGIYVGSAKQ